MLSTTHKIKKYLEHLPSCTMKQDWTEAQQALSDCPPGPDKDQAYQEMQEKMNTCSCGLSKLIESLEKYDWLDPEFHPLEQKEGEVLAFHPEWIHPDFNTNGIRVGFIDGDGCFHSVKWCNYHDTYENEVSVMLPAMWKRIK